MTKQTEALKLALEVLEYIKTIGTDSKMLNNIELAGISNTIQACQEALAQPEQCDMGALCIGCTPKQCPDEKSDVSLIDEGKTQQEPVAWICKSRGFVEIEFPVGSDYRFNLGTWEPLYTAPQPQPLTDEQIYEMWDSKYRSWIGGEQFSSLVRVIESKLRS